jgi:hypothetical protein
LCCFPPSRTNDDSPFQTPLRARDALRELRASGELPDDEGASVLLREGVYVLAAPLQLDARDSRTAYMAYEGETVELRGGVTIPPAAMERAVDEYSRCAGSASL